MEDLKRRLLNYEVIGEFLADLKEKFGGGNKKRNKVVELRRIKQEGNTKEEFVQEFRKVTRESGYKGRFLIKEFKREINRTIYQIF